MGKILKMEKNGEWGTQIELIAMAEVLGITISVTNDSPDEENFQVWVYPTATDTEMAQHLILIGESS